MRLEMKQIRTPKTSGQAGQLSSAPWHATGLGRSLTLECLGELQQTNDRNFLTIQTKARWPCELAVVARLCSCHPRRPRFPRDKTSTDQFNGRISYHVRMSVACLVHAVVQRCALASTGDSNSVTAAFPRASCKVPSCLRARFARQATGDLRPVKLRRPGAWGTAH